MAADNATMVATFKHHTIPNETASKASGRPIFDDLEIVELRFPGERGKVLVFPAHEADPNATREAVESGAIRPGEVMTYAQVYGDNYRRFKSMEAQEVAGTPLEELTFLTQAKRSELKALNIYTAEALASLDGTPLRQLGMGGRELKNQAQAYLDRAAGSADVTEMASRIAMLEQQLKDRDDLIEGYAKPAAKTKYQRAVEASVRESQEEDENAEEPKASDQPEEAAEPDVNGKRIEDCTDAELKEFIRRESGDPVRGNPSRATLEAKATEIATAPDT